MQKKSQMQKSHGFIGNLGYCLHPGTTSPPFAYLFILRILKIFFSDSSLCLSETIVFILAAIAGHHMR